MNTLSLRQKIGQLMVCGFQGDSSSDITDIETLIKDYHVGGIILFGRNIGSPIETLELTTTLQRLAKESNQQEPLLISIDQENGMVRRLGEGTTSFPGSMLLAATRDENLTYEIGRATARELKALGINWNLAPVVDINNNPDNPVIGVRSFGETAEAVSLFSKASMKGMQTEGVITTLKHFPGHGDTHVDSHLALPVITHSVKALENLELIPFKDCIESEADTVMTAHVYFPALEPEENRPATMSYKVITELLRNKLGFKGVVTTDCLEMKAISDSPGTALGAVEAIKAGVDLIMISHVSSLQIEAIEAIVAAVENGDISEQRIDESYHRVHILKNKYLSWNDIPLNSEEIKVSDVVGNKQHHQLAENALKKGITIVKNNGNVIPIKEGNKVVVIYPTASYLTLVEEEGYSKNELGMIVRDMDPHATIIPISNDPSMVEIDQLIGKVTEFDTILVGTLSARTSDGQTALLHQLMKTGKSLIVLAMRNPYDLAIAHDAQAFITTYEFTANALNMAVKAIYGKEIVSGTLPITIS
ncbi:beta-N-acetylhexosaminidase [Bacillus mesophilus]|uniref:Glycoside hydrolase family 3 protein n=1 Tax=Bacillus mesophilus TaxID=1808955 RepID=A0A6M0Q803_9BACI|nr:glycoside hydrolase family 3 protein [Bacillus mesophilus]MBM7662157.1 beta-N-acetylhexosaminidase [Bacillus mesophilus]NEY72492.1 glycoside hydrolase family 3 protein [Bacillus mesophilus]